MARFWPAQVLAPLNLLKKENDGSSGPILAQAPSSSQRPISPSNKRPKSRGGLVAGSIAVASLPSFLFFFFFFHIKESPGVVLLGVNSTLPGRRENRRPERSRWPVRSPVCLARQGLRRPLIHKQPHPHGVPSETGRRCRRRRTPELVPPGTHSSPFFPLF
jgi:hypothetical protein